MRKVLLDTTLAGFLIGSAPLFAAAQEQGDSPPASTGFDPSACGAVCESEEGLLFRLRSLSHGDSATGLGEDATERALQPDRRVTVAAEQGGRAEISGQFLITLPQGGVVWATEDPELGRPELSISAPVAVPFDRQAISEPVRFFMRSNYAAFVDRMELSIYRAADVDMIAPLATVPVAPGTVGRVEWDGIFTTDTRLRDGDELRYVLRAFDAEGAFDETFPRRLRLVRPEDAERERSRASDDLQRASGLSYLPDQAVEQSLIEDAFSANGLRLQNIPVHGSRVRIHGRDIAPGHSLHIDGENYPVDLRRAFAAEYLLPVGTHVFDLALTGPGGEEAMREELEVEITGRYFFGVGIADLTIYQNDLSGAGRSLVPGARDGDILSDGRLAFYGRAKFGGRVLLTAQADTRDRPLENLFDGFTSADPQDVFRRLDPDLYYPTYGDDSTTYRDVDTMGRFYLRADWDRSQALWGNFSTGITGTEHAQYVRSLYGAAALLRSRSSNAWGEPVSELRAFGSEAQTAPGHSEFIGTGGSLYYLRHTDLLPGSDHVVLEIRDRTSGRIERRVELLRGADYEIDELQGRVILTRPLSQLTRENVPTLTRDAPLDGFEQRLIVNYEWVPTQFSASEITAGARGKHWFGDHVGVGLTYVDENRAGEDYTLMSADVTFRLGRGSYLTVEHGRTESTSAPVFFSDNGGLSFTRLNPDGPRDGEATAVEARANLRELGWTAREWQTAAWWRSVDAGYSVSRFDTGQDVEEYGAEVSGEAAADIRVFARVNRTERGAETLTQAQASGEWRMSDEAAISSEIRRVEERRATSAAGLLGAVRYERRVGPGLDVFGTAQLTLDNDGGAYEDNNAVSLGGRYDFAERSRLGAEAVAGDRGNAVTLDAEHRLSSRHSLYGGYTYSTDRSEFDPLFNPRQQDGWTLGQRWRVSDRTNVFNESQFLKTPRESGLAHTFGLDFFPAAGWTTGFTVSEGDLTNAQGEAVERTALSIRGGLTSPDTEWRSKVEWREDRGAEQRTQWVLTNRLAHRMTESWRIAARFNFADTEDTTNPQASARFIEGNFGFAWRPWNSTRWGLFGRYTYLYDLATLGQIGGAEVDQKSQVLSLEGVHRLNPRWEIALRLARREGEVRIERGEGEWFDSAATFAAGQVRYQLRSKWHALAEYRSLDVRDGGLRSGWLVGVDRDVARNLRIGAGYNFTDFSDDLTDFDYRQRGWFINVVGRY